MGLDQYAFAIKDDERVELAYWRKHANLQGWMQELYHARGGTEDFNCIPVALDNDDLDRLEKANAMMTKETFVGVGKGILRAAPFTTILMRSGRCLMGSRRVCACRRGHL